MVIELQLLEVGEIVPDPLLPPPHSSEMLARPRRVLVSCPPILHASRVFRGERSMLEAPPDLLTVCNSLETLVRACRGRRRGRQGAGDVSSPQDGGFGGPAQMEPRLRREVGRSANHDVPVELGE